MLILNFKTKCLTFYLICCDCFTKTKLIDGNVNKELESANKKLDTEQVMFFTQLSC